MSNFSHYVFNQKNKSKIISKQTYQKILNDNQQEQCSPATIKNVLQYAKKEEVRQAAKLQYFSSNPDTESTHFKISKNGTFEIFSSRKYFGIDKNKRAKAVYAIINDILKYGSENLIKLANKQLFNMKIEVDENDYQNISTIDRLILSSRDLENIPIEVICTYPEMSGPKESHVQFMNISEEEMNNDNPFYDDDEENYLIGPG